MPGDYGSDVSKQEYERILSRLRVGNGNLPVEKASSDLTVAELVARFMAEHVEHHYRRPDGTPTGEKANWIMTVRPLVRLYVWTKKAEDIVKKVARCKAVTETVH